MAALAESGTVTRLESMMQIGAAKSDGRRFSHPLCPYLQYARYNGSGDPDDAANFNCVTD